MGHESTPEPVALVYKVVAALNPTSEGGPSEIPLRLDVYPPAPHSTRTSTSRDAGVGVPVVVYFHGGGLLVGDRKSWFPEWLHGESFSILIDPPPVVDRTIGRRSSIRTRRSFSVGGLPITLALHGTRYPRGHPRSIFIHPE